MKYGERLRLAREHKGLSQDDLVKISGVKQGTISKIERGDQNSSGFDAELSHALDIEAMWLKKGLNGFAPSWLSGEGDPAASASPRAELSSPEPSYTIGEFDLWDGKTPLRDDEVELPFFREVELAAGSGRHEVIENHGCKLRFSKSTLKRKNVDPDKAACVTVNGNSMEPVIPDGCVIGIDTDNTAIKDGDMYAINHDGELRVKLIYKMPGGGLRLRSFNIDEWPDEPCTGDKAEKIKVLGRVFWYSVLR